MTRGTWYNDNCRTACSGSAAPEQGPKSAPQHVGAPACVNVTELAHNLKGPIQASPRSLQLGDVDGRLRVHTAGRDATSASSASRASLVSAITATPHLGNLVPQKSSAALLGGSIGREGLSASPCYDSPHLGAGSGGTSSGGFPGWPTCQWSATGGMDGLGQGFEKRTESCA